MSQPFVGEIRLLPYGRGAPTGWQVCNGALLSIANYETLYTLLGTIYGGDGVQTFGVPDLRGAVPIHNGTGRGLSPYQIGQKGGAEAVTLNGQQMGAHFHTVMATTAAATATAPEGNLTASVGTTEPFYATVASGMATTNFPASTISFVGKGQPHANTAPTLTLNYCIATIGYWPSQQ